MKEPEETKTDAPPRAAGRLLLLRAGGQTFAVRAEEAEGVAERPDPAPLPHAPAAVLGVVSIGGRMYTLLDPPALLAGPGAGGRGGPPRFAVALRGDEQLALAAESLEGPLEVPADAPRPHDQPPPPLRAALEHEGARVLLLDPSALFDAAMRGTERRRQRS